MNINKTIEENMIIINDLVKSKSLKPMLKEDLLTKIMGIIELGHLTDAVHMKGMNNYSYIKLFITEKFYIELTPHIKRTDKLKKVSKTKSKYLYEFVSIEYTSGYKTDKPLIDFLSEKDKEFYLKVINLMPTLNHSIENISMFFELVLENLYDYKEGIDLNMSVNDFYNYPFEEKNIYSNELQHRILDHLKIFGFKHLQTREIFIFYIEYKMKDTMKKYFERIHKYLNSKKFITHNNGIFNK